MGICLLRGDLGLEVGHLLTLGFQGECVGGVLVGQGRLVGSKLGEFSIGIVVDVVVGVVIGVVTEGVGVGVVSDGAVGDVIVGVVLVGGGVETGARRGVSLSFHARFVVER